MVQRKSFDLYYARTAGMLSGARRVAMLLATLLLNMTAQTAWADAVTLTQDGSEWYVNMPWGGTNTLTLNGTVTTFKVYDNGGKNGDYSPNCNGFLILTAPTGCVLQLSGSITTEYAVDNLFVYDGIDTNNSNSPLLYKSSTSSGTQTAIPTVTSTGNNMTLKFKSDGSDHYAGLDLTVTLIGNDTESSITVNTATGGSVAASVGGNAVTKAKFGNVVTLTASPSTGYLLNNLSVVDANSNVVALTWNVWTNTATFVMPTSAVTVTPAFTSAKTAAAGLYINMPTTGTKTATIPSGVTSFKVYDDGGSGGNYSNLCDGTLVLTAPTGYRLQLSGNITTENISDNLTVYDNNAASGTKLLDAVSSTSDGTQTAISTVTSTGRSMTLYFYSEFTNNYAGLDLTVTLIKEVELSDNADNTTTLNNNDGVKSVVTLDGRTIYTNGDWNTLCLPFSMTAEQIAASPLAGFIIKKMLTTSSLDNTGKLTLNFEDATTIEAGKPYIVRWNTAVVDTSTPIFNPADDVVTALNFISGGATKDGGNSVIDDEGPAKLVDGDTGTKYFMNADPWVEFHYASAITPKGYALWTANDAADGSRNPTSWTIKAKVNSGDAWTTLVTVDNSAGDKLPKAINTRTVFALNNSTAYKYFRFEAVKNSNGFQLAELQFCTEQPTLGNITNPVFNGVTIDATAPTEVTSTDGKVKFVGQYSPFTIDDSNIHEILYITSGNKIGYSSIARTLKSCRAHFWVQPNGASAGARTININLGDDVATSIITMSDVRSKMEDGVWYTLDGRKLAGLPTQKGLYIVNGKKVVIK